MADAHVRATGGRQRITQRQRLGVVTCLGTVQDPDDGRLTDNEFAQDRNAPTRRGAAEL